MAEDTQGNPQASAASPAVAAAAPEAGKPNGASPASGADAPSESASSQGLVLFSILFYGTAGATIWAFASEQGKRLTATWPLGAWTPAAAVAVLATILFVVLRASSRLKSWISANTSRQGFFLAFLGAPALLGIVLALVFLPPAWQVRLIRFGFILVAVLLPAVMYYLFIVTRKGSLLSEFLSNAGRLGLLRESSDANWRYRAQSYFQKFEAAYGPIPHEVQRSILDGRSRRDDRAIAPPITVFVSEAAAPVLLATFLLALLWVVTLPPVPLSSRELEEQSVWARALSPELTPITAAFLGAYFFSLQLLFRRYVRKDLRSSVYVGIVLRILVATLGIWVVTELADLLPFDPDPANDEAGLEDELMAVGFVVGFFPRVALQLIVMAFQKVVSILPLPNLNAELPIGQLQGLTLWHEDRLADEDIENVPNMASADLLELMINTRIPANRLVDWVDQAILYTAIGPEDDDDKSSTRAVLARNSLHTASAVIEAYQRAQQKPADREAFEGLFPSRITLQNLVTSLETSPSLAQVRLWRGTLEYVAPGTRPSSFPPPPPSGG